MPSIAQIQKELKAFDSYAQHTTDPHKLQLKWKHLFGTELTNESAKSFITHYRTMRSRKHSKGTKKHRKVRSQRHRRQTKHRGGMAPLDYVMTPGADVPVYGRFPVELDTNPAGIFDLDRYFQDSLTLECGKEDISLHVPPNMGSNLVGGARKRKVKGNRRTRKHRGGGWFDFMSGNGSSCASASDLRPNAEIGRPYVASVYPNVLQRAADTWSGATDNYPAPSAPEDKTWQYKNLGTPNAMNPKFLTN
jgi:hypothetical protein